MDRRLFMASALVSPVGACASAAALDGTSNGVFVPAGKDRDQVAQKIWGLIPLEVKVSTKDSKGALFVFEHADMGKGGPPRHLHHEQDEWFYAVKGEFAFEVGNEKLRLKPGDSLFAPRKIPHVWACVSDKPGTLLISLNPAGDFEKFIRESTKLTKPPTQEEAEKAFAAHGMKVVGPPLKFE